VAYPFDATVNDETYILDSWCCQKQLYFHQLVELIIETSYHEIQEFTQICIQQTSDIIITVIFHIAGGT